MRYGIVGFILGVILVLAAVLVVQQRVIHDVEPDLSFRFDTYVFDGPDFPKCDFDSGRLVHRALFPARYTTTFYDAHDQEVTQADKPGRYGVVVRMRLGLGHEVRQFITLYRAPGHHLPGAALGWDRPLELTAQLPDLGLDPNVVRTQAPQINGIVSRSFVTHGETSRDLAILLAGLSETQPGDPPAVARTDAFARDADWWFGLRQRLGLAEEYNHFVELPRGYDADPAKKWPLMLYLVSRAEYGTDIHLVHRSGLARRVEDGQQVPAIVVAPQCPYAEEWNPRVLNRLLDEVSAKYRVDPDRIYVTGGTATWQMALQYPDRLAAIVPIWCQSDPDDAARLKDLPVWAFDDTMNQFPTGSPILDMVTGIRKAGGHAHLTIAPPNQDVWELVYSDDAVFNWLFAQKRGQPEVMTPGVAMP
jgi:hypothetical protein